MGFYYEGKYFDTWNSSCNVEVLLNRTIKEIKNIDNVELHFFTNEDEHYVMYHEQDCCENVSIEDIVGDLDDLIGSPILMAEEITEDGIRNDEDYESSTWTFYKFATNKGYVTIRWYGESNGYYSESVDFIKLEIPTK